MIPVIGFAFQPSPAILNLNTMELEYLQRIEKNHEVFKNLSQSFNYAYINDILVIPEQRTNKSIRERTLIIKNLELECYGEYVLFFHFEVINDVIFADSLTLPEFKFLKDYCECVV